jgi:hypothetical protein
MWRTVGIFPRYDRQSSTSFARAPSGAPGFIQK